MNRFIAPALFALTLAALALLGYVDRTRGPAANSVAATQAIQKVNTQIASNNKQLLTLQQRSTNLNSQVQTANSTAKSLPQLTALFAPAVHIPLPQQPLQSPKPQQAPAQQTQVQQAQQQTAILQSQIAALQEQSAALQQELTIFQQQNQELVNTAKQAAAATQATATPPDVAVIDAWMPLILTALILIGGAVVWFKDKDPEHRKWVYSAFSAVLGFWFKSAGS
jgi:hypothetical protein